MDAGDGHAPPLTAVIECPWKFGSPRPPSPFGSDGAMWAREDDLFYIAGGALLRADKERVGIYEARMG